MVYNNNKHRWFSGRIIAFQAVDPGSIPGRCIFYIFFPISFLQKFNVIKNINTEIF